MAPACVMPGCINDSGACCLPALLLRPAAAAPCSCCARPAPTLPLRPPTGEEEWDYYFDAQSFSKCDNATDFVVQLLKKARAAGRCWALLGCCWKRLLC